tara:strand:+ start:367 stop:1134 length:768 start_codon:yes stop_codon:yes gene_type:complete
MSNPFMKKFNESESRGLNGLLLLGSFGVFSLFIGMITEERKKGNNRAVRDWSIAFGVSFALGILISLADFDILINKDNLVIDLITKGPFLLFSGAPYVLVSGLTSATNSIIGENGSKAFGLDDLNSKYGGRINQVVNLGKSDSSFIFMNTFKYSKRESILPCKTAGVKGVCQVRRSVIYMVFYLAALLLIPLFITLGDIKNNNNEFDREQYVYYLVLFSAITIGLVILFVLSTVKSMAGSDVFGDTDIRQGVEAI